MGHFLSRRRAGTLTLALALSMTVALGGCGGSDSLLRYLKGGTSETPVSEETLSDVQQAERAARQQEFRAFLAEANARRETLYGGEALTLPAEWADDFLADADAFTKEEITALLFPPGDIPKTLTRAEAAEDIRTLFRILRQGYAAYNYFGGEEAFSALERRMVAGLSEEGLTPEMLAEVLSGLRELVTDNQLVIGDIPMVEKQSVSYYLPDVYFDDPTDIDPALLRRTADGNGRLRYTLGFSTDSPDTLPETAVIEGKSVSLAWEEMRPLSAGTDFEKTSVTAASREDGSELLASRTFLAADEKASVQLDALSRVGGEYRSAPVLIWDIRGCSGGSDRFFRGWFAGFAGNEPDLKVSYAAKISELNKTLLDFILSPGWYVDASAGERVSRDGVLFVLQDAGTASTGENVLLELLTVENILSAGGTTPGAFLTGNCVTAYLPHSGLAVQWGTKLQQVGVLQNPDGTGCAPDLWIPPQEALERVGKVIGYYALETLFTE